MSPVSAEGLVNESRSPGAVTAVLTIGATFWVAVSVVVMTYGTQLNWPDYSHVNFGFPMVFATHTLNTIMGPVDWWDVNLSALIVDFVFWLGGAIAILLSGFWYYGSRNKKDGAVLPSQSRVGHFQTGERTVWTCELSGPSPAQGLDGG